MRTGRRYPVTEAKGRMSMGISPTVFAERVFTKLEQPVFETMAGLQRLGTGKYALARQQERALHDLGTIHTAGAQMLQSLPKGATPKQVEALHTAGGRLRIAV